MNVYLKRLLFTLSTLCLCFALYTPPAEAQVVVAVGQPHHHHHHRHHRRRHHHPYHH